MRIGSWKIIRVKKDRLGRPLHPWEEITLDQLAPETRLLISKMARVAARDFYEGQGEQLLEWVRPKLRSMVNDFITAEFTSSLDAAGEDSPEGSEKPGWGTCLRCGMGSNEQHRKSCEGVRLTPTEDTP